ncbi:MAG: hypothetical protein A3F31_03350 [Candidatus Levybacteria bacterium RIFCSPHIGHO2_12_FULL_38_12]|nr:MAG: hypothetical protein A2770_03775 [Candidatus Levybacteria bacterium RIFCSPHIGHO2_01_FULL_38_12]OGH22163.1 MAG: hypothetical protein A3D75_02720 [Candidatus Levybacteria bacterium RIFCSPHIGHO2_02_FULL_37_18]OGH23012.1 MAG: hypothetical protein A3F31_03350 [Candidatus Levybacteria bacterium RIFCSPHIGHO2_12_FULL_38_12]OGH34154.1 MAG: hypothetical protein A3A47_03480 [Candidatus Levybacteria bacterium RIFCSPLOWO2_01_FULL_37_20]OGH44984.1 MAG: hypothetical protein A3J14_01145 [Candidatus Lev
MADCVFCKIVNKEIPAKVVYEDSDVIVFPDIHPVKPIHLLIVPKKHVPDLLELSDDSILVAVRKTIQKMVKETKLNKRGFRVGINGGGAQAIDHVHIHLMGPMGKAAAM